MSRWTLSDAQWARIEPRLPGKKGDRGRTGADNRPFVDAVLWLARTASSWQDLPAELGNWRTVHCRVRRCLPSDVDSKTLTKRQIIAICHDLNATPRKCLGYRTPAEIFREKLMTEADALP